jgi:hypothetical protein
LDQADTIPTLNEMFEAYEPMSYVTTFVLCGEFISQKMVDSFDFEGIKFCFDSLAECIKKYDRIKTQCRFIIVPGVNDP